MRNAKTMQMRSGLSLISAFSLQPSAFILQPYGEQLLDRLSTDLSKRFGRGFSSDNLLPL
jgi:hypothetical protein